MIFKSPDQAPGQLRIFLDQRLFISLRKHRFIFHTFEKKMISKGIMYLFPRTACDKKSSQETLAEGATCPTWVIWDIIFGIRTFGI